MIGGEFSMGFWRFSMGFWEFSMGVLGVLERKKTVFFHGVFPRFFHGDVQTFHGVLGFWDVFFFFHCVLDGEQKYGEQNVPVF